MATRIVSVETVLVYNLGAVELAVQIRYIYNEQDKTWFFNEQTCENASVKASQHVLVHSSPN